MLLYKCMVQEANVSLCDVWQYSLDIVPNLARSIQSVPWTALFVATSDSSPGIQQTYGKATDSCFGLIGTHQCGGLMVIAG